MKRIPGTVVAIAACAALWFAAFLMLSARLVLAERRLSALESRAAWFAPGPQETPCVYVEEKQ